MTNKLVEVIRNGLVESIHTGNIAIVDNSGKLLHYFGEPEQFCYFRSSGKPFILLSHLMKQIHEYFGFTLKELAIMSSSHNGSENHVKTLMGIAEKIGVGEGDLVCGVREPYGTKEKFDLYRSGKQPGQWHNNCSGKHLGFLATCKVMGWPYNNYADWAHPIQKDLLETISDFSSYPKDSIRVGIDGCGVPVYGVPLKNMALAYARLFDTGFMDGKYSMAQKILYEAVTKHPDMIAGDDRIDTELIRLTGGDHFGKMGADGVFCIHMHSAKMGFAMKVQDGSVRAVEPVVVETFAQLHTLPDVLIGKLNRFRYPPIMTWGGKTTGFINPVFTLKNP